ncbi:MAG: hypothetical protein H6742_12320 [Alphaproteobacteria bacterium]|nr:hypothetical protein [Alphaproteobacteria bacterium]
MPLLPSLLLPLALTACTGGEKPTPADDTGAPEDGERSWQVVTDLGEEARSLLVDGDRLLAIVDNEVWESPDGTSWLAVPSTGLPDGELTWLGAVPGGDGSLLAHVHGHGMVRFDGTRWADVASPPASALISGLNPRAAPVPFDLAVGDDDSLWLAAAAGLFRSTDGGASWGPVNALSDAGFNILFAGVDARDGQVAATAFRPAGVLPNAYAGLLTAGVFWSDDGGDSWSEADPDLATRYPVDVAFDADGGLWLATQDEGLLRRDGDAWISAGGPVDALGLSFDDDGGLSVLSGTQGIWRLADGEWTQAGTGPMVAVAGDHALGLDGTLYALQDGAGTAPPAAGGATVYVAVSMHGNLYHSYRGDTVDDDGFGLDLDVMRDTLTWLSERPEVHADWDFDNYWSTDTWMQEHGADIIEGVAARVDSGADDVRLMSWNNGAMSAHTRDEFDVAIGRAWDSNRTWFSEVVPGVQPQECMFTPEHIPWYVGQGVEWITLFNSATGFTALRPELALPDDAWTNPSTITYDGASMAVVPVYHHADLLDHGGLRGWVRKLHQAHSEDQLLVIHFDADAESWEAFGGELDALDGLDFVAYTTIQDYLDDHPATVDSPLPYDMADGSGDGYQSWAEKTFNHEIATTIAQGREVEAAARAIAPEDLDVDALLEAGLPDRLLALSTTNFGLAAPDLHEDRMASARAYAGGALDAAWSALALAESKRPAADAQVLVTNVTQTPGTALVELTVEVPASAWTGPQAVALWDEADAPLPVAVTGVDDAGDPVLVDLALVVALTAGEQRRFTWGLDEAAAVNGAVDNTVLTEDLSLDTPFTECLGVGATGSATDTGDFAWPDARDVVATRTEAWDLSLCDAAGGVQWTLSTFDGLPGVVVQVDAAFADTDARLDAESVALSPILCDDGADTLRWRTMGGAVHERAVRQDTPSWNGQVVASWAEVQCGDGSVRQLSHRVAERTSLAMLPMRTLGQDAVLAPLGTLWGSAPPHDNRLTGGHGMADVVTEIIGSQFRPAAPDWTGATVSYRLLLGTDALPVDEGTLELFAHPPHVQVGAFDG